MAKASLGLTETLYPVPMLMMIAAAIVGALYLERTVMGRHIFALGGNPEASRFAGLRLGHIQMGVFLVSGLTAGLAAFLGASFYGSASCGDATGYELYVIASAVVGGASLTGGKGSAISAMLGALLIVLIRQSIRTLRLDQNYEWIVIGCAIIIAVVLDQGSARVAARRLVAAPTGGAPMRKNRRPATWILAASPPPWPRAPAPRRRPRRRAAPARPRERPPAARRRSRSRSSPRARPTPCSWPRARARRRRPRSSAPRTASRSRSPGSLRPRRTARSRPSASHRPSTRARTPSSSPARTRARSRARSTTPSAAGLAVMTFDSDAPQSKRFTFYGVDDLKTGQTTMAELATQMGGKGKVAVLQGNQNAPNLQKRVQGVREEAAKHPGIEIVGVFPNIETPQDAAAEVIRVNNAYPRSRAGRWSAAGRSSRARCSTRSTPSA
jgi:hypothetical protein